MYSESLISSQINSIEKILNNLSFIEHKNFFPTSPQQPGALRKMTYPQLWKELYQNDCYHFQLSDNSLLFFRYDIHQGFMSFNFYDCPYKCLSYDQFLTDIIGFEDEDNDDLFMNDYEIYLDGCELKKGFTIFRYDYFPMDYREGLHPASHLHIGFDNNVRVGIRKILNPLSFVFIVIRQHYPDLWAIFLRSKMFEKYKNEIKENLSLVKGVFWNDNDKIEFALH